MQLSSRIEAKRRRDRAERLLSVLSAVVTIGGFSWSFLGSRQRSEWVPGIFVAGLGILMYLVGTESGRAAATLAQPRRWEEIEHRDVVWGWGSRVAGAVMGPYCPNHSKALTVCRTREAPDDAVISASSPMCCPDDPSERFALRIAPGQSATLRELREEVREQLETTLG